MKAIKKFEKAKADYLATWTAIHGKPFARDVIFYEDGWITGLYSSKRCRLKDLVKATEELKKRIINPSNTTDNG